VRLEWLGKLKNKYSFTSSGLETAAFRLPAYCLNHYATARPFLCVIVKELRDFSPRANYIDLATAASRRSQCQLLRKEGCRVVNVTGPYSRILGFLDRSRYFFFQVAPQLFSRGWVDPVPDTLLLRTSGSAGSGTRTSGYVARGGLFLYVCIYGAVWLSCYYWEPLRTGHSKRLTAISECNVI
jgi:hypothetical protein